MPRSKGHPKSGGRVAGTPNKRTKFLVEAFEAQGYSPVTELVKALQHLSLPNDAIQIATLNLRLIEFLYPKRKAIDFVVESDKEEIEKEANEFLERHRRNLEAMKEWK